jgi:hypothetical protein
MSDSGDGGRDTIGGFGCQVYFFGFGFREGRARGPVLVCTTWVRDVFAMVKLL